MNDDDGVSSYEVQDLIADQRIPRHTLLGTALMSQEILTVKRSFPADHDKHALTLYGVGTIFLHKNTIIRAYIPYDDVD
jgi:hypothetical protein